jgi:hypothetical protein
MLLPLFELRCYSSMETHYLPWNPAVDPKRSQLELNGTLSLSIDDQRAGEGAPIAEETLAHPLRN